VIFVILEETFQFSESILCNTRKRKYSKSLEMRTDYFVFRRAGSPKKARLSRGVPKAEAIVRFMSRSDIR